MNMKFFAALLFFLSAAVICSAQEKIYSVTGRLCDTSGSPVQFAHVVNMKKRTACISNQEGVFRLLMMKTDTIKISCLGFETAGFTLQSLMMDEEEEKSSHADIGIIILKPKTFEHEVISVYAERWKAFVYEWSQIDPEEEPEYVDQIETWKSNLIDLNELKQITQAANGIGIPFGGDRKRKKAEAKINEDKRQTALDNEAAEKYNSKIVADITGMSIEEAEKFMLHFKLDRDFILRRNDYDLYMIIKQLYKEYTK